MQAQTNLHTHTQSRNHAGITKRTPLSLCTQGVLQEGARKASDLPIARSSVYSVYSVSHCVWVLECARQHCLGARVHGCTITLPAPDQRSDCTLHGTRVYCKQRAPFLVSCIFMCMLTCASYVRVCCVLRRVPSQCGAALVRLNKQTRVCQLPCQHLHGAGQPQRDRVHTTANVQGRGRIRIRWHHKGTADDSRLVAYF